MPGEETGKRAGPLASFLAHLSRIRKRQIVVFLDNADQRPDTVQDAAFLIAQEMASHWPTLVYVTLRPETFHRSAQTGVLTGYHPKAFTIAPPRTERVIETRLQFAIELAQEDLPVPTLQRNQGTRLLQLRRVLQSFLASIRKNNELLECIDNIAGGNMRVALNLVKDFFGSGHVDTQEIVEKTTDNDPYIVSVHQFLRAAIFGDAVYYDPNRSPVANLYDISTVDPREHFLLPLLLGLLRNSSHDKGTHGFVEIDSLYESLQSVGYTPDQIDFALVRAFRKKLVETPAGQNPDVKSKTPRSYRITTIGLYHVDRLSRMFTYFDAMTVVTPILDDDMVSRIRDVDGILERIERGKAFRGYLDQQWQTGEQLEREANWKTVFDWKATSKALERDMERIEVEARRRRR